MDSRAKPPEADNATSASHEDARNYRRFYKIDGIHDISLNEEDGAIKRVSRQIDAHLDDMISGPASFSG